MLPAGSPPTSYCALPIRVWRKRCKRSNTLRLFLEISLALSLRLGAKPAFALRRFRALLEATFRVVKTLRSSPLSAVECLVLWRGGNNAKGKPPLTHACVRKDFPVSRSYCLRGPRRATSACSRCWPKASTGIRPHESLLVVAAHPCYH